MLSDSEQNLTFQKYLSVDFETVVNFNQKVYNIVVNRRV